MIIDRQHKPWAVFSAVTAFLAAVAYAAYWYYSNQQGRGGPRGSSIPGLTFGIAGFGLMIFCGLLGVRKKVRIWRIGRAQTWLRAHIWLGLLAVPLIFFHSGLKWGNNLTLLLMVLFAIVTVSGIVGVILQNVLPRVMFMSVPAESTFEQIPRILEVLREEADELVVAVCGPLEGSAAAPELAHAPGDAKMRTHVKTEGAVQGKVIKGGGKGKPAGPQPGSEPLKAFYVKEVRPFLAQKFLGESRLATGKSALALFEHARALVPPDLHETLQDMEGICEERRQLARQQRLHFWLHSWLFVHVPLSYALLILSLVHALYATFWIGR